jgi:hypothetical protein
MVLFSQLSYEYVVERLSLIARKMKFRKLGNTNYLVWLILQLLRKWSKKLKSI